MSIEEQTADGGRAIMLPRRTGFFVRHRARLGLLPGHVSTAALVQARRFRWLYWFALPVFGVFLLIPIAALASHTSEKPNTIAAVLGPFAEGDASGPYEVLLVDGRTMFFDRDPGVHAGEVVRVRQRGSYPLGLVVDGRYVASTNNQSTAVVPVVLFSGLFVIASAVSLLPAVVWGRRVYKDIRSDLNSPSVEARGRYVGSWVWRGATSRMWLRTRPFGLMVGFPVAIDESTDELSWYGAPLSMVSEVRHFETQIAGGARNVVVTYHPRTRALARIATPDGSASIDFDGPHDELHPETGLSLKVSRRRRHAHLPDW